MKKFLVLGILVGLIFTGSSFGQEAEQQEEEKGLPVPAPYLLLFPGVQWSLCDKILFPNQVYKSDIELACFLMQGMSSTGELLKVYLIVIIKGNKETIIGGWIRPFTENEQGFFIQENGEWFLTDKEKDIGYKLECDSYYDEEANLILVFLFKEPILTVVREINIRKFVEEQFKDNSLNEEGGAL